ncbi:hypothetical protein IJ22_18230 [Paenibacillus naphthalenovorans]|uniref:YubB ferredoxin-like domain-containing protein n=2 Tax=Paenibacillus naphthalenovorans TaxID=162209 RepID=A0A0U2W3Y3_9BACL|nr:hypothetical protein IJ22_18230 [Paenibacillus naphthalenovorans]
MYYSLRCKLKLKQEFIPQIDSLLNDADAEWSNITDIESIKDYSTDSRSSFIPFGVLAYSPDNWDDEPWRNEIEDDIWTFQCSVKTSSTIRSFFKNVVPVISEKSLHIEYFYEENDFADLYELRDGAVVATGEKIKYGYKDEDPWRLVQIE